MFPMMYLMCLLKSSSYICGGESAKSMKFPTDSSSFSLSVYHEFLFEIVKVEYWWVEIF